MTAARDLSLETLQIEQDGRVLTARFSNPPLNFMTTVFIRELDQLTRSVDRDPTVGAAGFLAAGSTKAAGGVLKPFIEDFERLGDTPFLADPGPWIGGTRFDQVD